MITKNEQVIKQLVKEGFAELDEEQRLKEIRLKDVGYTQRYFIGDEEYKKVDNTISMWVSKGRYTLHDSEALVQVIDKRKTRDAEICTD